MIYTNKDMRNTKLCVLCTKVSHSTIYMCFIFPSQTDANVTVILECVTYLYNCTASKNALTYRSICLGVSYVLCQYWDFNVPFIYVKKLFKFSMKIHLGDEAQRDRGIFLKTENTAPLYSKSQNIATIILHCVIAFSNSNIIHQLPFGSYFRFLHVFKYRHTQWRNFKILFLTVFPYTLKVKLIFSNQQTAILGFQLRFHKK